MNKKMYKLVKDSIHYVSGSEFAIKSIGYDKQTGELARKNLSRNLNDVSYLIQKILNKLSHHWCEHQSKNSGKDLYIDKLVMDEIKLSELGYYNFIYAVTIQAVALLQLPFTLTPLTGDSEILSDRTVLTYRGDYE